MNDLHIDRRTLALPPDQYVRQRTEKDLVVLHHTAGGSDASSVSWWLRDPKRIATAFVIGRDGDVFQCFDPHFWAWHLGIGGSIEKRSIGIELANWGGLTKKGRRYVNWAGREVDPDDVLDFGQAWRGYRYWEAYTDEQVEAAIELTRRLVALHGIDPDVAPSQLGAPDVRRYRRFRGVIAHHHVRADKSDVHPGFPWGRLTHAIEGTRPDPPATPTAPPVRTLLQRGDSGDDVGLAQGRLKALGFYRGAVDDVFGPMTDLAVRRFQQHNGLAVDGVLGPRSLAVLYP